MFLRDTLPVLYGLLAFFDADSGYKLLTITVTDESWPASPFVLDVIPLLMATYAELKEAGVDQDASR